MSTTRLPPMQNPAEMGYTIKSKAEISQEQEEEILKVSHALERPRGEAIILLTHHFKWHANRITKDEWLDCQAEICQNLGLLETPIVETSHSAEKTCKLCSESFSANEKSSVSCHHEFCHSCWKVYIDEAINAGPDCLNLRCPSANCNAAVTCDMMKIFSSREDMTKFDDYLLDSYVIHRKGKWCPASGCQNAAFYSDIGYSNTMVKCNCTCLYSFCSKCNQEAHAPVDCNVFAVWMSVISEYSQNCSCGLVWSKHLFRQCGIDTETSKQLQRFRCYHKEWTASETSCKNAFDALMEFQRHTPEEPFQGVHLTEKERPHLAKGRQLIVECRQFLKWTYAYAYFLPEHESDKISLLTNKRGEAMQLVMKLEKHVKDLYLLRGQVFEDQLLGLTRSTKACIDNMKLYIKYGWI